MKEVKGSFTHTSIETPRTPPKVPYALDLSGEEAHIDRIGDAYLPVFIDNLRALPLETDTNTAHFSFRHAIKRQPDGSVELFLLLDQAGRTSQEMSARESYARPLTDPSLSDWERQRAMREYEAVLSLEQQLATAEQGDVFIEASNAPFDRGAEDLHGTYYGDFSFYRTHTLSRDEQGREVLEGKALRHYLTWEAQTELYKSLTQDDAVTPESLLGTMRKLNPADGFEGMQTLEDVKGHIDELPSTHKVVHEVPEDHVSLEDLHAFMDRGRGIVIAAFGLLKEKGAYYQEKVMKLIKEWRKLIRNFNEGHDSEQELIELKYQAERYLDALYDDDDDELDFDLDGDDSFDERANSCGFGMGFSGGVAGVRARGLFGRGLPSYLRQEALMQMMAREEPMDDAPQLTGPDKRQATCPSCNTKVVFSRSEVIRKEHIACGCGASARGCDAVSIAEAAKPAESGPSMLDYDSPLAA